MEIIHEQSNYTAPNKHRNGVRERSIVKYHADYFHLYA